MVAGIETDKETLGAQVDTNGVQVVSISDQHQRLTQVTLLDETDRNNQLVQTREWLLHANETEGLLLSGNLFVVECLLTGAGKVFIKCAPLPHVRRKDEPLVDLTVSPRKEGGFDYRLHQTGPADLECWQVLDYDGSVRGCTCALHRWQKSLRPSTERHRVPRFLSNSWGDRNRDARIRHDFILAEIATAVRLGVEVVQIDDGWQKGRSSNSAEAHKKGGGVWSGFWESDPEFWTPDPERFPNGLAPLLEEAAKWGVELGLWYAPDSCREFANWRRDADHILSLHRTYRINHFKLDSISAETITARRNLRAMLSAISKESAGEIVCDLDVTAGTRPGYFGEIATGPLFVENRYTDWHNYWPHFTLRNLWQLSHWISPCRLRMELLNNERNSHKYAGDPLAPSLYPPATLFAITMFSNPLGWFENTGLSDKFINELAPLVRTWRAHRERIFAGDILPMGEAPDGIAWTGFCSVDKEAGSGYALVFNERNLSTKHTFILPQQFGASEVLGGVGLAEIKKDQLAVKIESPFGFLFVKLT